MVNNLIVCGGTFDHLHKGHESLLKLAFSLGKKVVIGVTSDIYVDKLKIKSQISKIEMFEKRKQAVLEFVKKEKALNKVEIVKIEDMFGPTLSKDLKIDAIVVSKDSKGGADIINQKRKELNFSPLKVFIAPQVLAEDGKLIASQRIRNGEINRTGRLYVKPSWLKTDLIITKDLRRKLKKPLGDLYREINVRDGRDSFCVITVGDATTKKFNEKSIGQEISVVDFKIARKQEFSSFSELGFSGSERIITVNNPPGHITSDLFNAISEIFKLGFKNRIILKIMGEDDLAVLPLVLAAPLETIIYYGQPGMGMVKIQVSERKKEQIYNLVSKFRPI